MGIGGGCLECLVLVRIFFSFKTHFHLPFQANHTEASFSHFVESTVLVLCLVTFKLKLSPVLSYGKCMLEKNK